MTQNFTRLKTLQELDSDLKTLRDNLEEVPKRIKHLQDETARAESALATVQGDITEHKKQYKLADVELKAAEEKIATYSVQLYSAKTNEQYKAFLKEIETQKKTKQGIEDRMIVLMEESEALERQRVSVEKTHSELKADSEKKVKSLEEEKAELEAAIAEREKHRAEVLDGLDSQLLKLYERIRAKKSGIAVVVASDGKCQGCFNPVPAQRVLEIARQDRVYTCEACGRILLPDDK